MNSRLIRCAALLGSLAVHAGIVLGSSAEGRAPRPRVPPAAVQLLVAARAPEPELPEPDVPAPPEPPKAPKPKSKPAPTPQEEKAPEPQEPIAEPLESPPAAPLPELTGATLVNDSGVGWAAPLGNGASRDGAIHSGNSHSGRNRLPVAEKKSAALRPPEPSSAVPLSQLSRRPEPPPLSGALERNYPREARSLGRSGAAKVRARIEASGAIQLAKVTFETSPGFGDACRRVLLGSKWSVPLDQKGKPAATWVTYQCKFRIDD